MFSDETDAHDCRPPCREDSEAMTAVREANDKWDRRYGDVSALEKSASRVRFSAQKPAVKVLRVWSFAARSARCGQWEQVRRDRERFADKCRQIERQIGHVFGEEHRRRQYCLRFGTEE